MLYGFFSVILALSLMGSVLTAMIMLVKALFGTRIKARWHYYIWLLLLARLVIPFAPQHSFSVYNLFKPFIESREQQSPLQAVEGEWIVFVDVTGAPEPVEMPAGSVGNPTDEVDAPETLQTLSIDKITGLLWAAGALTMAAFLIGANLRFRARLRRNPRCRDKDTLAILDACRKELGIKRHVPLVLDPRAGAPLLSGLIRPVIVSSHDAIAKLTNDEKRCIFLHELMHLKRLDILLNWVMAAVRCVYWFNPVIWYAFLRMKEDCEYACDEGVLEILEPVEYKLYGHTILKLIKPAVKPIPMTCTTGMAGRKPVIERRIKMIAKFRKKTLAWTIPAIVLTLLVGCSSMTGAELDSSGKAGQDIISQNPAEAGQDITNQNPAEANAPDDTAARPPEGGGATPGPSKVVINDGVPGGSLIVQNGEKAKDVLGQPPSQGVSYDDKGNITCFVTSDKEMLMELSEELNISIGDPGNDGLCFIISASQNDKTEYEHMSRFVDRVVRYYIDKLKDKSYTDTYGEGYTWYTAAEELGKIGKPAIPYLIEKLKTTDDYERSLALYALLLATQHENVKAFAGNDYINVNLDFNAGNHPPMVKVANDWWEKYKDNF